MTDVTATVYAIFDAASERMDAARAAYDEAAARFLADDAAGIEAVKSYRTAYYAELDAAVADAEVALSAIGPCEFVDGRWVTKVQR